MILTVGCSFTAGEELSKPANDSWPALVSGEFNLPLRNLGLGGGSNDYIFRTVIEETAKQAFDIVIVEWTEPSRMEVWWDQCNKSVNVTANSRFKQIGAFTWMEDFYRHSYSDFFGFRKQAVQCIALQEYLKSIGQRYLFANLIGLRPHGYWTEYRNQLGHLWDKVDSDFFVGWPHDGLVEWMGDCLKGPGGHPLEVGHQRIAEKINEHIRNLGGLS